MPETKQISTSTVLNVVGSAINIITSYQGDDITNEILSAFISDDNKDVDSVTFLQGELGITFINGYTISVYLSEGELIIVGNDAASYSLDSSGNLIYTD